MKKAFLFITATLLLFGCQKFEDYLPKKECNDKTGCQIKSITQETFYGPFIATFYYNSKGDPDSILYNTGGGSTGSPEYHFVYNTKGRMTQLIEAYRYKPGYGVSYDAWHLYQYNDKGQIVSDTTYRFGVSEPGYRPDQGTYVDYEDIFYTTYTYDAQGRIIQTNTQGIAGSSSGPKIYTANFTYDAAGNQVREGVAYSTARNINTTNSIWQFLNRDYSVNSPLAPTAVNEQNLPLGYGADNGGIYNYFLSIELHPVAIAYNCGKN